MERGQLCLICLASDHLEPDCLVRRLCTLCRRRHNTWVHVPEDDEAETAAAYATTEHEPDYEWMYEPGLTGECIGEGFIAYEEGEQEDEEDDDLHYAYAAIDTALGDSGGQTRRSQRIAEQPRLDYRALDAGPSGNPGVQSRAFPSRVFRSQRPEFALGSPATEPLPRNNQRGRRGTGRGGRGPATPLLATRTNPTRPGPTNGPNAALPQPGAIVAPAGGRTGPLALCPTNGPNVTHPVALNEQPAVPARQQSSRQMTPRTMNQTRTPIPVGHVARPTAGPVRAAPPVPRVAKPAAVPVTPRPKGRQDHIERTPADKIGVGLQQTLLNVQNPKTKEHMTVNALVDSGANHSAISGRLAKALGLGGVAAPYRVVTFGGATYHQPSRLVQITMRTADGRHTRTLVVRSVDDLCGNLKVHRWNDLKYQWPHMQDLSFDDPVGDCKVDLLIGTENADFVRVVGPDVVGARPQDPLVRRTVTGLMPMGLTRIWEEAVEDRVNLAQAFACLGHYGDIARERLERESLLYGDLRRIFAVEHKIEEDFLRNAKDDKTVSQEQARAAAQVHASRVYLRGCKRYRAAIPWRSATRPRSNLWAALDLFRNYVRRRGPHSDEINTMTRTIAEWIERGYARVLAATEARRPGGYVIPSFVVTRVDKTTTQHRLVINAAKEFEGACINDFIAKTPDVMNDLYGVLLRFRVARFTYTADIQRMFLQVEIEPEDRRYIRVLYQPDRPGPIHLVECQRHMFGLRSSPYVAMEVIKTHAREHRDFWPHAAQAVLRSSIVDDVLVSVNAEDEVDQLHRELEAMFAAMSMEVHKCASNLENFMARLEPDRRAKQVRLEEISSINPELMPVIKTLGMVYEPTDDAFRFEYAHESPRRWTLRNMASAVAKVYDPLGLVTPFLMSGRAIVQLIWLEGKKWDDPLSETTAKKCELWTARARELVELRIPRRVLGLTPTPGARLTVFCDACRLGYAAAVYATLNGNSALVASRGRVAPAKKDESVQRLELAGCQLAAGVASEVCSSLGLDIGTLTFYTDSMTALAWLRTTSKMSVFVSNRVCKVRDRTDVEQWRHVPGELNPADLASRGCRPRRLAEDPLWLHGPDFLRTGEEPEQPDLVEDNAVKEELISFDNHLRKVVLFRCLIHPMEITPYMEEFVTRRELPGRAVRVLSLVIEATRRLRRLPLETASSATLYQELWEGILNRRVRKHQREAWPEEIARLERGQEPPSLRQLQPYAGRRRRHANAQPT